MNFLNTKYLTTKMFLYSCGINYACLLLVLVVGSRALIVNGTGETCGELTCGYKASCLKEQCHCEHTGKRYTATAVYCLEGCRTDTDCSTGTTCQDLGGNTYRCSDCDKGYIRSSLGQCINYALTTTENSRTPLADPSTTLPTPSTPNSAPSTTSPTLSTPKPDSLPLYIGLGVGIASFILLVVILVILVVVIRKRKRARKEPAVRNEGGTMMINNLNTVESDARGAIQSSESPVDLSDESKEISKEKVENNLKASIPRPVTHGRSGGYENFDIKNIHAQGDSVNSNIRLPQKSDNSEASDQGKTVLDKHPNPIELYSNHKIPENKGKAKPGKISNLKTATTSEGVGEEIKDVAVNDTGMMDGTTQLQDSNPYNTLYDLKPTPSNQREEITMSGEVSKNKANDVDESNDNPYSLAGPVNDATGVGSNIEAQTTKGGENDYDELKLQILSKNGK